MRSLRKTSEQVLSSAKILATPMRRDNALLHTIHDPRLLRNRERRCAHMGPSNSNPINQLSALPSCARDIDRAVEFFTKPARLKIYARSVSDCHSKNVDVSRCPRAG
jgi:hypothetical protein